MADETIKFDANADGIDKAVRQAIGKLRAFRGVITDAAITSAKLTKDGKVAAATIKYLADNGALVTAQFKRLKVEGGTTFGVVGTAIKNTTTDAELLTKVVDDVVKKQEELARSTTRSFVGGLKAPKDQATPDETLRFAQISQGLEKLVLQHNVTLPQIDALWQQLQNGSIELYQGDLLAVAQQLLKLKTAYENLGAAARKSSEEQQSAAEKSNASKSVSGGLFDSIGSLEKYDNRQKLVILEQVRSLTTLAVQHNITKQTIQKIWADVAGGTIQKYTGALEKAQADIVKLQSIIGNFNKGLDEHGRKVGELTISWQSFARVLAFTLTRGIIFKLQQSIIDATKAYAEFDTQLASVRTIDDMNTSVNTLSASLITLSNTWGLDVVDQANAAYETLSNQIAEGTGAITFLNEANKLAVTTFTSTKDAADLLSAAINAYGLEVGQAAQLSASFFATVDLGRVKVEQIAQTYGRVAAPAAQLNISINEVNAALAVLTKRGIPVNEAMTALRGIFQKLIRPSEEMKKLFQEIGVANAEIGLQTYGFPGFLEILNQRTQGASDELGELFQRIRAINGAIVLAGDGFQEYGDVLKRINGANKEFGEATETVLESASKKYRIEINKIRNAFIKDFGRTIVSTINGVDEQLKVLTYDTVSFSDTVIALGKIIKFAIIPTLAFLIAQVKILKVGLASLTANPAALTLFALAAAIEFVVYQLGASERAFAGAEESAAKFRATLEEQREELLRNNAQLANLIRQGLNEQNQEYARGLARNIARYTAALDQQEAAMSDLDKNIETYTKGIVDNLNAIGNEATNNFNKLRSTILSIQDDINKTTRDTQAQLFQYGIEGLIPEEAINEILSRINELRDARREAVGIGDKSGFDAITNEINNLIKQRKQLEEQILNEDNIGGLKQYFDIRQDIVDLTNEELRLQKELSLVLRDQAAEEAKRAKEAQLQALQFQTLLEQYKSFSLSDILATDDPQLISQLVNNQKDVIAQLIDETAASGFDTSIFEESLKRLETFSRDYLNKIFGEELQKNLSKSQDALQGFVGDLESSVSTGTEVLNGLREEAEKLNQTLVNLKETQNTKSVGFSLTSYFNFQQDLKTFQEALNSGTVNQADLKAFLDSYYTNANDLVKIFRDVEVKADLAKQINEFANSLRNYERTGKSVIDIIDQTERSQTALNDIAKQLGVSFNIQNQVINQQAEKLKAVNVELERYRQLTEQIRTQQLGSTIPAPTTLGPLPNYSAPTRNNDQNIPAVTTPEPLIVNITLQSVNPQYDAVQLGRAIENERRRGRN